MLVNAAYYIDLGNPILFKYMFLMNLLKYSLFWAKITNYHLYQFFRFLVDFRSIQNMSFRTVLATIEFCIYLDIYLILKNPFYPTQRRMPLYYGLWIFVGVLLLCLLSRYDYF
jgi:hypothetical protein